MAAFIAAFSWQPLSGGAMIGAEVGRRISRFGERRVPKYGGISARLEKGMRLRNTGPRGSAEVNRRSAKAKRQRSDRDRPVEAGLADLYDGGGTVLSLLVAVGIARYLKSAMTP
jgi:hypothetical protein